MLARNTVVDTVTSRAWQAQDETLFPRVVAFRDDAKTAHMEDREWRLREGPASVPVWTSNCK